MSSSQDENLMSDSIGRFSLFSFGLVSVLEPSPRLVEVEGLRRVMVMIPSFFGFENLACGDSRLVVT